MKLSAFPQHLFSKMIGGLLLIGLASFPFFQLFAQDSERPMITDLQMILPPDQDLSQRNSVIPIFVATLSNGKKKSTDGNFNKFLPLRRFYIEIENGKWHKHEKMISYKPMDVSAHGGDIHITLREKKLPNQEFVMKLHIPYPVSWEATYDLQTPLVPGQEIPIHLDITFSDGSHTSTHDLNNRLIWPYWKWFDLRSNAELRPNKTVVLPHHQASLMDTLWIEAAYRYNPKAPISILDIPIDYNGPQHFNFGGGDAQAFPKINGQDVNVCVSSVWVEEVHFLHIRLQSETQAYQTYLNPDQGTISIDCSGGHGASGRTGSTGMDGNNAMENCPATSGENGGNGGSGYAGGNGGQVYFFTDRETEPYLSLIQVNNSGGAGGEGGAGGSGGIGGLGAYDGSTGNRGADGPAGKEGLPPEIHIISTRALQVFFDAQQGLK